MLDTYFEKLFDDAVVLVTSLRAEGCVKMRVETESGWSGFDPAWRCSARRKGLAVRRSEPSFDSRRCFGYQELPCFELSQCWDPASPA